MSANERTETPEETGRRLAREHERLRQALTTAERVPLGQASSGRQSPNIVVPDRFTAEGEIDGYRVSMVLESDFGFVECVQIAVEAANAMEMFEARERGERQPMKVTGEILRRIPVSYLVKEATRQVMAEQDETRGLTLMSGPEAIPPEILAEWPDGQVDVVLRWVASRYRRAAAIGDPPNKAVQEATGWSRATVGRVLKLARERGIMSYAERGFASFGGPEPQLEVEPDDLWALILRTAGELGMALSEVHKDFETEFEGCGSLKGLPSAMLAAYLQVLRRRLHERTGADG